MNKKRTISLGMVLFSVMFLGQACGFGGGEEQLNDGGIWKSTDHGETWEQKVLIYSDRAINKNIATVDAHTLLFSPADTRKIFALTEQSGIWASWDAGNHWDSILPTPTVYDLIIHPENHRILYAALNASIVKSEDEGATWRAVYTSDKVDNVVRDLSFKSNNPSVIYGGTQYGEVIVSENAGASWRSLSTVKGAIKRIESHPASSTVLYIGVDRKGLGQSKDSGTTWKFFDEEFRQYSRATSFRDFALTPTGIIYASDYGLLRSLNQGSDWTSLPLISPERGSNILSLDINPSNPFEIYYGTGARATFYRSSDGGFNWIPRSLPTSRTVRTILVDPENPETIYIGAGTAPGR